VWLKSQIAEPAHRSFVQDFVSGGLLNLDRNHTAVALMNVQNENSGASQTLRLRLRRVIRPNINLSLRQ